MAVALSKKVFRWMALVASNVSVWKEDWSIVAE